jgi:hypothetical protein
MPPASPIQVTAFFSVAQRCGTKPGLPSIRKRRKTSCVSAQTPLSTRWRAKCVREIRSGLPT